MNSFLGGMGGSAAVFNPGSSVFASGGSGGRRLLQTGETGTSAVAPQTSTVSTLPTTTTAGSSSGFAAAPSAGIYPVGGAAGVSAFAPAPSAAAGCLTVEQIIQQTPNLSVLRSLLPLLPAELKRYLTREAGSQFTLFAPNDQAFRDAVNNIPDFAVVLDPSILPSLVRGKVDVRALTALLAYDIVPNATVTAAQLRDGQVLQTALKGANLRVSIKQAAAGASGASGVDIKGIGSTAAVVQPDIQACRGIVHIVDSVLLPISLQNLQNQMNQNQQQQTNQQQSQQQSPYATQQPQVAAGGSG